MTSLLSRKEAAGVTGMIALSVVLLIVVLITALLASYRIIKVPVWYWPLSLFVLTFAIGILSPMTGVGGGVIFVPLVSALYPFHVDFVRGTGLIMAVTSALGSTPKFLREGMASLRVGLPASITATITSIIGAIFGLEITRAFPQGKYYVLIALGVILLIVFAIMLTVKRVEFPEPKNPDIVSRALNMRGSYFERTLNKVVNYHVSRGALGLAAFAGVGLLAGMFGLGAGWASVPVLNLIMSLPLKVATSTSMLIIALTGAPAIWVYVASGAILPILVAPTVVGMYIGSNIGAKLAIIARPVVIKYLFLAIMLFAAFMNIYKGLHGLGFI